MFTRLHKKAVALIAIVAVAFAALMPGAVSYANAMQIADVVALGGVCSVDNATDRAGGDERSPPQHSAAHGHCVFCTLGAPLLAAPRMDALLVSLPAAAAMPPRHRNEALPPHVVALHPLSPRAPPRAI